MNAATGTLNKACIMIEYLLVIKGKLIHIYIYIYIYIYIEDATQVRINPEFRKHVPLIIFTILEESTRIFHTYQLTSIDRSSFFTFYWPSCLVINEGLWYRRS